MFTGYFFTIWCRVFVLFGLRCCHANYKSNGGPFSTLVPTFRFHTSIEKREKESGPMKTSSYYFRTKKKEREKKRKKVRKRGNKAAEIKWQNGRHSPRTWRRFFFLCCCFFCFEFITSWEMRRFIAKPTRRSQKGEKELCWTDCGLRFNGFV